MTPWDRIWIIAASKSCSIAGPDPCFRLNKSRGRDFLKRVRSVTPCFWLPWLINLFQNLGPINFFVNACDAWSDYCLPVCLIACDWSPLILAILLITSSLLDLLPNDHTMCLGQISIFTKYYFHQKAFLWIKLSNPSDEVCTTNPQIREFLLHQNFYLKPIIKMTSKNYLIIILKVILLFYLKAFLWSQKWSPMTESYFYCFQNI